MGGCMSGWVGWWVGSGQITKNWIYLDLIEIFQLFEDSTSVEAPPPMGGNMGGWVGWWMGSGQITKNRIYLDLIEIFQFCLKIQHRWRLPHPWVGSLHRCWIFKQNWNIAIRSRFIQFFSDLTWPHPSTHPTTHTPTHGWGASTDVESSNRIEISQLGQGLFNFFSDLTWPHPSTHPTTHTPTHGWGSLHRCWIFKQNWNISIRSRYIRFLVIWPDPTHQPTQPPIHPPMGGGVTTDVESSNRTEISQFVLNLLNFYWNELPIVTPYSLRYK